MSAAMAVALLQDAYPRADFPDRTVALYGRMLADLDDDAVTEAVRRLINGSRFLPTIAEIRAEVAEAELDLPTASEAWEIATRGRLRGAPPEVQAAAEDVGGRWAILHGDRPETLRAQFMKIYAERRKRSLAVYAGASLPRSLPALSPGPTLRALPESERIRPRPVMARWLVRMSGRQPEAPTDEEKHDAIEVLRIGYQTEDPKHDPLYREAEAIFMESDR